MIEKEKGFVPKIKRGRMIMSVKQSFNTTIYTVLKYLYTTKTSLLTSVPYHWFNNQ